jgi:hypothetical protein
MSEINESKLSFSVELNSREHIKRVSLPNGTGDRLMVEGSLGKLIKIELIEDILLEIKGVNGTLRIEITREELEKMFNKKSDRGKN